MKNLLKKIKKASSSAPRPEDEIKREYSEVLGKAGNAHYLVYTYTQEAAAFDKRLQELNQEAYSRQQLDAERNAEQAKKEAQNAKP